MNVTVAAAATSVVVVERSWQRARDRERERETERGQEQYQAVPLKFMQTIGEMKQQYAKTIHKTITITIPYFRETTKAIAQQQQLLQQPI